MSLYQQATLETRDAKAPGIPLAGRVTQWQATADRVLGDTGRQRMIRTVRGPDTTQEWDTRSHPEIAEKVLELVSADRSTWNPCTSAPKQNGNSAPTPSLSPSTATLRSTKSNAWCSGPAACRCDSPWTPWNPGRPGWSDPTVNQCSASTARSSTRPRRCWRRKPDSSRPGRPAQRIGRTRFRPADSINWDCSPGEHTPGHDELLDLGRALFEPETTCVPVDPLDRCLHGVAVPAVHP